MRSIIAKLFRKAVKKILKDENIKKVSINTKNIHEYLDNPIFEIDPADKKNSVGVTNGLAWTAVGGDVLKIEAVKIKGKGLLQVTGNLGDVMKESSRISYSVVKLLIDDGKMRLDVVKKKENSFICKIFILGIPSGRHRRLFRAF